LPTKFINKDLDRAIIHVEERKRSSSEKIGVEKKGERETYGNDTEPGVLSSQLGRRLDETKKSLKEGKARWVAHQVKAAAA